MPLWPRGERRNEHFKCVHGPHGTAWLSIFKPACTKRGSEVNGEGFLAGIVVVVDRAAVENVFARLLSRIEQFFKVEWNVPPDAVMAAAAFLMYSIQSRLPRSPLAV